MQPKGLKKGSGKAGGDYVKGGEILRGGRRPTLGGEKKPTSVSSYL